MVQWECEGEGVWWGRSVKGREYGGVGGVRETY